MKLICAGYPKTGTKSCSSALRELGYNVADYMDTMEFLALIWRDYIEEKAKVYYELYFLKKTINHKWD